MGAMPGMEMSGATPAPLDLIPVWVGWVGAAVFGLVLVNHLRHAFENCGARRWWHGFHVLMAASMILMYLPGVATDNGAWQALFLVLAAGVAACAGAAVATRRRRRRPSGLWLLVVLDLAVMAYMWGPGAYVAPVSWVIATYLVFESLLWLGDGTWRVDGSGGGPVMVGGYVLSSEPLVVAAPAMTLTSHRDLRVSMFAMTLGMAYMIVAMQLMS